MLLVPLEAPRGSFHVKNVVVFSKKEEVGFTYSEDVLPCFYVGMIKMEYLNSPCKLEATPLTFPPSFSIPFIFVRSMYIGKKLWIASIFPHLDGQFVFLFPMEYV